MTMAETHTCHDCGREADPKYTMSFEDIGKGFIYWCDVCGPEAHAMDEALDKAFKERGAEFAEQLMTEIERAASGGNQ